MIITTSGQCMKVNYSLQSVLALAGCLPFGIVSSAERKAMCAWLCIIMLCTGLLKRNFQYVDLLFLPAKEEHEMSKSFWSECLTLALRVKTLVGAGESGAKSHHLTDEKVQNG